jgi:Flp pilus assembly protein TadB
MNLIMAYCFVAFTAIMVAALLFLGWQHHRDEARHEKERKEALARR